MNMASFLTLNVTLNVTLHVTLNVTLNTLFFCPSVSLVNSLSRVDGNVEAMVADGAVESLVGILDAHRDALSDAAANTAGGGGGGSGGGGGGGGAAHQEQLLVGAASSCLANLTSCEGGMTAFMACGGVRRSIIQ